MGVAPRRISFAGCRDAHESKSPHAREVGFGQGRDAKMTAYDFLILCVSSDSASCLVMGGLLGTER